MQMQRKADALLKVTITEFNGNKQNDPSQQVLHFADFFLNHIIYCTCMPVSQKEEIFKQLLDCKV